MRILLVALAGVVLFHGGLLPFTHGNTYDAFIHMFFADSYHRSWFDPWEPRWYTGFATTSYPPGAHMSIAALMHVMPLRAAFVVVQLGALVLLTIGVYRFSLLWVTARPAGYAALALVLSSAISETVHLFGQLPTTFSLGIFLNGVPYVYRWIVAGKASDFLAAVTFTGATTAAHHVTTIFGGVLFIIPIGIQALRAAIERRGSFSLRSIIAPLARGIMLTFAMVLIMVTTVFAYWYWSINDPITQVPIPHGSRESFIDRPDLGFIFFLLPWGPTLFLLPYVAWKTFTTRLMPLGLSILLCFVLGSGGTTPIPRAILKGAFDVLTLDRFTFWATILILPFVGYFIDGLLHGRSGEALRRILGRGLHRTIVGSIFLAAVSASVFAAILPTIQPTQPRFIDPTPVVRFLEQDEHYRWRYLTLGFGDQFAYLSANTRALSVDGNYHSARRLPDMTRFSVERLENAKYLGVPGLGSLQQFLVNADAYNLKYVFSNDDFYDPLLHFTGWTRLNRLPNGVTVWEKPDVAALPAVTPRREIPVIHMLMWGTLPPLMLLLAALTFFFAVVRRGFGADLNDVRPVERRISRFNSAKRVRGVVAISGLTAAMVCAGGVYLLLREVNAHEAPETTIAAYFEDLDFRRFQAAYKRLDPANRPDFENVMFNWRWEGGLIASYGKLQDVEARLIDGSDTFRSFSVSLDWLTALGMKTETVELQTVKRDGAWFILPTALRPSQVPTRLQRGGQVAWNVVGRRQPRNETDFHRDRLDRPRIWVEGARLVRRGDRYSLVGALTNTDADPAIASMFAELTSPSQSFSRQSVGDVIGQRLLSAETSGFRIDFEGVLSLEDAERLDGFDPTLFIPPELPEEPTGATLEARALVSTADLYRGVALNGVKVGLEGANPVIQGTAVNAGSETATVVRIVALLHDERGAPVWAEAGYVETNIYPGQSAPFRMILPARSEIEVIADVPDDHLLINGSTQQADISPSKPDIGTIPVDAPGYTSVRLQVSSMTYDPLL